MLHIFRWEAYDGNNSYDVPSESCDTIIAVCICGGLTGWMPVASLLAQRQIYGGCSVTLFFGDFDEADGWMDGLCSMVWCVMCAVNGS